MTHEMKPRPVGLCYVNSVDQQSGLSIPIDTKFLLLTASMLPSSYVKFNADQKVILH